MMPLNRPSPKTPLKNQKLRLYLAYNRSYDTYNTLTLTCERACDLVFTIYANYSYPR